MNTTFIYALCDPRTLEVRYVGKADNIYERLYKHLHEKEVTHKAKWIQSLLNLGMLPIYQILEECDTSIWQQREKDWIAFEKKIGCNLTNATIGGDGVMDGKHHTFEARAKIKVARKKQVFTEESNKRRSRTLSNTLKVKGATWTGKHFSEEHRKKISLGGVGKSGHAKGIPAWNKGLRGDEYKKHFASGFKNQYREQNATPKNINNRKK